MKKAHEEELRKRESEIQLRCEQELERQKVIWKNLHQEEFQKRVKQFEAEKRLENEQKSREDAVRVRDEVREQVRDQLQAQVAQYELEFRQQVDELSRKSDAFKRRAEELQWTVQAREEELDRRESAVVKREEEVERNNSPRGIWDHHYSPRVAEDDADNQESNNLNVADTSASHSPMDFAQVPVTPRGLAPLPLDMGKLALNTPRMALGSLDTPRLGPLGLGSLDTPRMPIALETPREFNAGSLNASPRANELLWKVGDTTVGDETGTTEENQGPHGHRELGFGFMHQKAPSKEGSLSKGASKESAPSKGTTPSKEPVVSVSKEAVVSVSKESSKETIGFGTSAKASAKQTASGTASASATSATVTTSLAATSATSTSAPSAPASAPPGESQHDIHHTGRDSHSNRPISVKWEGIVPNLDFSFIHPIVKRVSEHVTMMSSRVETVDGKQNETANNSGQRDHAADAIREMDVKRRQEAAKKEEEEEERRK